MTISATPRPDAYSAGFGPFEEFEVDDPDQLPNLEYGHVGSLSGGKAIPVAAEAAQPFVSRGWRYDQAADKYYVSADFSGAHLKVAFASAAVGAIEWIDNQTVQAAAALDHTGGYCFRVTGTNEGLVVLRNWGHAPVTAV